MILLVVLLVVAVLFVSASYWLAGAISRPVAERVVKNGVYNVLRPGDHRLVIFHDEKSLRPELASLVGGTLRRREEETIIGYGDADLRLGEIVPPDVKGRFHEIAGQSADELYPVQGIEQFYRNILDRVQSKERPGRITVFISWKAAKMPRDVSLSAQAFLDYESGLNHPSSDPPKIKDEQFTAVCGYKWDDLQSIARDGNLGGSQFEGLVKGLTERHDSDLTLYLNRKGSALRGQKAINAAIAQTREERSGA